MLRRRAIKPNEGEKSMICKNNRRPSLFFTRQKYRFGSSGFIMGSIICSNLYTEIISLFKFLGAEQQTAAAACWFSIKTIRMWRWNTLFSAPFDPPEWKSLFSRLSNRCSFEPVITNWKSSAKPTDWFALIKAASMKYKCRRFLFSFFLFVCLLSGYEMSSTWKPITA